MTPPIAFTCLLDNLQAAFLEVKLRHLPSCWIERRLGIAKRYREGLSDVPELTLPHWPDSRIDEVFQNYVIRTHGRDALYEFLKENGMETLIHWRRPYYSYPALGLRDSGFPETEAICREVLSLPMNVEITDQEVTWVITAVRSFFGR